MSLEKKSKNLLLHTMNGKPFSVLSIGTEARLMDIHSPIRTRIAEYGQCAHEMHIVVLLSKLIMLKERSQKIAENVYVYPVQSKVKYITPILAVIKGLAIIRSRFDSGLPYLVTAQDPFVSGFVAMIIARIRHIPLHVQVHTDLANPEFANNGIISKIRLAIARIVLSRADSIRAVSRRVERSITRNFSISCIPHVLPVFVYEPRKVVHTLSNKRFEHELVIVARLENEKNVSMAINILCKIRNHGLDAGLTVVGDGSMRKKLEKVAERYSVRNMVDFVGWQQDVAPFYTRADIALNTSLYEGYGLSLIEAARTGLPVITADVGIIGELLTEDEVYICPVRDADCFVKKILYCLSHDEESKEKAMRARQKVLKVNVDRTTYLVRYQESLQSVFKPKS